MRYTMSIILNLFKLLEKKFEELYRFFVLLIYSPAVILTRLSTYLRSVL